MNLFSGVLRVVVVLEVHLPEIFQVDPLGILHVLIFLKEHQKIQQYTEGFVGTILTNSLVHNRGIKVRLTDGRVGRIQKILE